MNEGHLRIGDLEREQAASVLGEHYAQGRLTTDEHAERLDRIWAARTRSDLKPVFADLPGRSGPAGLIDPGPARRPATWSGGVAGCRRGLPTPLVLALAVLLVLSVLTHLPWILAGALVAFMVMSRRRGGVRPRHWSRHER